MHEKMAALYCRVAREDQLAIEQQQARLERFARSMGLAPGVVYLDNGYSGLLDERPGFQRLNKAIANGEIGTVIAVDESRIGRQVVEVQSWLHQTHQRGIKIIFEAHPNWEMEFAESMRMLSELQAILGKGKGA